MEEQLVQLEYVQLEARTNNNTALRFCTRVSMSRRLILFLTTLLLRVPAPALDFVDADLRVTYADTYKAAVHAFRDAAVCKPPRERYTAQHRGSPHAAGERLVLPLHERRVPIGSNYEWHFLFASKLDWPGDSVLGQALSPDLECATQHTFHSAMNGTLAASRLRAASLWAATCQTLRTYSAAIVKRHAPQYAHMIMADTNVACMAANIDALDYRDRDLARQLTMGFDLVGCPVPDSRVYRPAPPTPERLAECNAQLAKTRDETRARAWASNLEYLTRKRATRDPEAAAAVWNATKKELARALVRGPFDSLSSLRTHFKRITGWDKPPWPMPRFARWQGITKGYRAIDDGKGSGTNRATALLETIVCPSFDFTLTVARENARLARAAGRAAFPMSIALHDLTAAYRFLPNSQPHMAVWPVAHADGSVKWFYMPGHPFGCVSSVMSFNRHAEALATIARSLGVPTEHYYDDFILPDLGSGKETASHVVETIVAGTGDGKPLGTPLPRRSFSLDLKKKQPAATINLVLGVETDLTKVVTGAVVFRATAARRKGILDLWQAARTANKMYKSDAASLQGKTGFALTATFGRVGRAATLPLVQRQHHDTDDTFTPALEHAAQFFEALLGNRPDGSPRLPDMVASTVTAERQPLLVYTDASFSRKRKQEECSDNSDIISRLGFVIHDPEAWDDVLNRRGLTLYATAVPSLEVLATFSPFKRTYISQLEALAALTVYSAETTWRGAGIDLRGRTVNHFIDNTAALSAFINGYSKAIDMAKISNMFWLLLAGMRTRPYLEYVPSLSNIADLPSRGKYELLERLGARRVYYVPLIGTTDWNAPLTNWIERGARDE